MTRVTARAAEIMRREWRQSDGQRLMIDVVFETLAILTTGCADPALYDLKERARLLSEGEIQPGNGTGA